MDDNYLAAPDRYQRQAYRAAGRHGLRLPGIGLGLWHNFGAGSDPARVKAMVHQAFDLGITHFDLANNYGPPPGSAETCFGRVIKGSLAPYRDELIIASKAGYVMWDGPYGDGGSAKYLFASLHQSQTSGQRLETVHFRFPCGQLMEVSSGADSRRIWGIGEPRERPGWVDASWRGANSDKAMKTAACWCEFRQEKLSCFVIDKTASRRRLEAVGDSSIALHISRPQHPATDAPARVIQAASAVNSCTMGKGSYIFGFDLGCVFHEVGNGGG